MRRFVLLVTALHLFGLAAAILGPFTSSL